MKWHVNKNSGIPAICNATVKACPHGGEGDHFPDAKAAVEHFERKLEEQANEGFDEAPEEVEAPAPSAVSYKFPAYKLDYAEKQILRANRRAEKAGIPERIGYTVRNYEQRKKDDQGFDIVEKRVELTLDRPVLKHNGWTFAGTMTWDEEAGLITRMVPGESLMSPPQAKLCDVCKTTRHRTDTYIVQKGDEQVQVGSNCLKKFMGIQPAGLWMLDYDLDMKEGQEDDNPRWAAASKEYRRDSEQVLGIGLAVAEQYGWVSKKASIATGKPSTAERVREVLDSRAIGEAAKKELPRLRARAMELQEKAKAIREEAQNMEGSNDFANNLRKIASAETVSERNLPTLLASIGVSKQNEAYAAKEEAKKTIKAESEWVGKVGNVISLPEVTVEDINVQASSYGYGNSTYKIITMRDADGNVFKTFYSGAQPVKVGKSYVLKKAKIKAHGEWQGTKETTIERMKLESVRPSVKPKTELPDSSPYADAWTPEENDKASQASERKLKADFKKKAGKDGWNSTWNEPNDADLLLEYKAAQKDSREQYSVRHRELEEDAE